MATAPQPHGQKNEASIPGFLASGGEMGQLIAHYNWSDTSLGPISSWPVSLRTILGIILHSGFPKFLFWGKDLICFYNDAYRPSLGVNGKHPAIGKKGREVWPEIWDFIGPLIEKVMTSGEYVKFEDQLVPFHRNGSIEDIYWTFTYSPAYNDNGEINGVFVTCTETTQKVVNFKQLEESKLHLESTNTELQKNIDQLRKAKFDLDNFIYTASHDLKAPVSNIEGLLYVLSDMIDDESCTREELNDVFSMMNTSIQKFAKTILDLTTITKIQKDTEEESLEKVNLVDVINDIIYLNEGLIADSCATFTTQCDTSLEVSFSRKNLRSILHNLITNAVKYRSYERHLEILIFTERRDGYIIVNVKDNGLGLDQNKQKRLFSMFKRFHDHVEGTGIGLYLVKRIITNAGGKIEVKSQPDVGSTFSVYFKE